MTLLRTSRVTGGITPVIRFEFSDGSTLRNNGDGSGLEFEDPKKVDLISEWFRS